MANMLALARPQDSLTQLLPFLPRQLAPILSQLPPDQSRAIFEIRITIGRPMMVATRAGDRFVAPAGLSQCPQSALIIDEEHVSAVLDAVTASSVYAVADAMRAGYIPLPGGHRVGLAGELKTEGDEILGFRRITGLNIRVSRPLFDVADPLLPALVRSDGRFWSTIVVAPPGGGKTTLLRDLVRALSQGRPAAGLMPHRVGVADERGELAGLYRGAPQIDLGPRTDVIGLGPKRTAMTMLIRSMGPEVIATDEIGHPQDVHAVQEAVRCGVSVLCSAHAATADELSSRPSLSPLLREGAFDRIVVLSRRCGPGTVERIIKGRGHP